MPLHAQEYIYMNDTVFPLGLDLKRKKKTKHKKDQRPSTDPPNFQAETANTPLFLGLSWLHIQIPLTD